MARAENWAHWRGPDYNGSTPDKGPALGFTKTSGVKWKADMPGVSAATPVIWDDKVFVTAGEEDKQKLHAICLDRKSGKVLWDNVVGEGYRRDNKSTYASPSPVTDGKIVVFFFGGAASPAIETSTPRTEIVAALAGPLVSLAIGGLALVLAGIGVAVGSEPAEVVAQVAFVIGILNLVLGGVNLLPAFPLDGGRVARAAFWARTGDPTRALRSTARIGPKSLVRD